MQGLLAKGGRQAEPPRGMSTRDWHRAVTVSFFAARAELKRLPDGPRKHLCSLVRPVREAMEAAAEQTRVGRWLVRIGLPRLAGFALPAIFDLEVASGASGPKSFLALAGLAPRGRGSWVVARQAVHDLIVLPVAADPERTVYSDYTQERLHIKYPTLPRKEARLKAARDTARLILTHLYQVMHQDLHGEWPLDYPPEPTQHPRYWPCDGMPLRNYLLGASQGRGSGGRGV